MDVYISDCYVLGTFGNQVVLRASLDHDGVVKVRDVEPFNQNIRSREVDSVGVEREPPGKLEEVLVSPMKDLGGDCVTRHISFHW